MGLGRAGPEPAGESIEPNEDGSVWAVKLREGLLWHDGKPITADDVVYSMERIVDPKDPKVGVATLTGVVPGGTKKIDDLTVEFHLASPNVILDEALAERSCKIVPVGFDPKKPIGSGPFKMVEMKPGEQLKWEAFADYWDTPPYVDTLTVIEFADDTARINALQSDQIQAMSQLQAVLRPAMSSSVRRRRSSTRGAATSSGPGATRSTPTPRRSLASRWTSSPARSVVCTSRTSTSWADCRCCAGRARTPFGSPCGSSHCLERPRRDARPLVIGCAGVRSGPAVLEGRTLRRQPGLASGNACDAYRRRCSLGRP